MGRHTGASTEGRSLVRLLVLRAFYLLLLVVAWGVLVYAAIQLGPGARNGELASWGLLLVATLGAVACLFLALINGSQVLALVRGEATAMPSGGGGKRARR